MVTNSCGGGVRSGAPEFEIGVEHGHPDHDRSGGVSQRAPDEMPDPVGVQISIEDPAAVPRQAFQVQGQTPHSLVIDPHRGVVTVVEQSERGDLIKVGATAATVP